MKSPRREQTPQRARQRQEPEVDVRQLRIRSQKTVLAQSQQFQWALSVLELDPTDAEMAKIVTEKLAEAEYEATVTPDPFRATNPASRDYLPGNVGIGTVISSEVSYLITAESLLTHMLICGRTGGGKSNLILLILAQLLGGRHGIKVFDRKMEYHALACHPGFVYSLLGDFEINLIEPPPGENIRRWVTSLGEMLGNYLLILVPSRGLLVSTILRLCDEMGSRETGVYPTLRDVYHAIKTAKYRVISHLERYRETLENRIEGLLNVFGDHICSRRRLDWNVFMSTDWAISLDGIPTDYQNLFITIMVGKILTYRIANNLRNDYLDTLCVFDEASTTFRKWFENQEGTYLLSDYLARSREFGVGFIIGTQSLSGLADSVLANTGTKILVGGAGTGTDYNIFASATGATHEQREFLKQLTQPGIACCKDPRYPYPFTIKVPRIA